ncbi:MAG: CPBP family intramembrane metalloprotease [Methanobrevibacter sp.]|uniref:CPBP family glutamic-type intramembrane protease n=1 Tax=Methanobrevibacter sp. TaxID=66852 RepID=UPI0025CED15C|nr:CPBP family glutamic-type intramembrane protease [Methanobrevibacter sp.]MBE6498504.1 CPBP family intramembrane metalloprotease [Methanobrevibacter sp.]
MTDFFKFETVKEDLPFYNGVPEIPAWSWILLLAGLVAYVMLVKHIPVELNYKIFPIALMLSTTLPILIVARGNYGYFFKKISMGDVKYIILTVILSFIYSIVFGAIFYMAEGMPQSMLQLMGYEISISYTIEVILPLFIQLMGEELFKVIIILIMMLILYKFSKNRKASLAVSVFVALVLFGLMHAGEYGSFLRVIVVQGIGSIFDVLLYLKTKNVFASYLSHLLFDIISLSITGQLLF